MNKCKGDVCLLAGSPLDAITQYFFILIFFYYRYYLFLWKVEVINGFCSYNQSIEQLKSNSDWEWVAGCMEGFCASLVAVKVIH